MGNHRRALEWLTIVLAWMQQTGTFGQGFPLASLVSVTNTYSTVPDELRASANGYAGTAREPVNRSVLLKVPFLAQVPPGNWVDSKNCGQACALMVAGNFRSNYYPDSSAIVWLNVWLSQRVRDVRFREANGWLTGLYIGRREVNLMIQEYCRLRISPAVARPNVGTLIRELYSNHPVIVCAGRAGGRLVSSGGQPHWVVIVGWDAGVGEFILHDPGSADGHRLRYGAAQFDESWAAMNRVYAAISR